MHQVHVTITDSELSGFTRESETADYIMGRLADAGFPMEGEDVSRGTLTRWYNPETFATTYTWTRPFCSIPRDWNNGKPT